MKSIIFKRIMIFGRPGSGKSSFALELANDTGLPLYHLDKYFFVDISRVQKKYLPTILPKQLTHIYDRT